MVDRDQAVRNYTMRKSREDYTIALGELDAEEKKSDLRMVGYAHLSKKIVMIVHRVSSATDGYPADVEIMIGFVISETEEDIEISDVGHYNYDLFELCGGDMALKIEKQDIIRIDRLVVADNI